VHYSDTPEPYIYTVDMASFKKGNNVARTYDELATELNTLSAARVVLNVIDSSLSAIEKTAAGGGLLQNSVSSVFRLTRHHHIVEHNSAGVGDGVVESHEQREEFRGGPVDLVVWAKDSVNSWNSLDGDVVKKYTYVPFSLPSVRFDPSFEEFKLCRSILVRQYGNRSCFDICK